MMMANGPQCTNEQQYKLECGAGGQDGGSGEVSEGGISTPEPTMDWLGGMGTYPVCSCANGHTDTVEALVSLNVDVHRAQSWGDRYALPMRRGRATRHRGEAPSAGVRPSQPNGRESPRELALQYSHPQIAAVLEQAERQEEQCAAAQAGRTGGWCGAGGGRAPQPSRQAGRTLLSVAVDAGHAGGAGPLEARSSPP